jgi:hypothetical protein
MVLSTGARKRLWRPRKGFEVLAEKMVNIWLKNPKLVRMADLSPSALLRLLKTSKKATAIEDEIELKHREASDGRLLKAHDAWKALLDFKDAVESGNRRNPTVGEVFRDLVTFMEREQAKQEVEGAAGEGGAGRTG